MGRIDKFLDDLEETFAHIREREGGDSVCGLCEYDGAYIGESGDWCNECPGFNKDDCFKLSAEIRRKWKAQLSQEGTTKDTTTDTISRQAAIDAFDCTNELIVGGAENAQNVANYINKVVGKIKDLPSAQPYTAEEIDKMQELESAQVEKAYELGRESAQTEQIWIPCSERLPEDGENVLVAYKTTDKIHPCQYHDDGSRNPWYSYIDQCRAHMNVVLAWMPLPEPYKEGDNT